MRYEMIKFFIILASLTAMTSLYGQDNSTLDTASSVVKGSWYKKAPVSGSYGIDLEGAKNALKGKKIAKNPVVAIIGTGADLEHEAFKHAVWINPKEKEDGLDNDKNNFIDDISGWNYISGKDGAFLENTLGAADREWLRLKDKYAEMHFDGTRYFIVENGGRKYVESPQDMKEYNYFMDLLLSQRTRLGNSYAGHKYSYLLKEYVEKWDKLLSAAYPGKSRTEIDIEQAQKLVVDDLMVKDSLGNIAATFVFMYGGMMKPYVKDGLPAWELIYNNFTNRQIELSKGGFDNNVKQFGMDERAQIVGDNPNNINDKEYGTNQLMTPASSLGTLISGIIAGKEVAGSGFSGIMPEAKLMHLVVSGQSGEPYPKDLSLAIRYAVRQGADVILLPQQIRFISDEQKEWLNVALREAEKKGILIVCPVWETGENLDNIAYYPTHVLSDGKPLNNMLIVANSDENGNPFASINYSSKVVSLLAPGIGLYSTLPGDVYKLANTSAYGAAVTAGTAAFLKAYFPKLSAVQLKELLMSTVTDMNGKEVELNTQHKDKLVIDQYLYEQICQSGGILNLQKAVAATLKIKN